MTLEFMKLWQAIRVGAERGYNQVIIEGDDKTLIDALSRIIWNDSCVHLILLDTRRLARGFNSCRFQ
jgi:DNA-directed RNA polymerase subunit L